MKNGENRLAPLKHTEKAEASDLKGKSWHEAASIGNKARHDLPALMMHRLLRLANELQTHITTHVEKQFAISFNEFRVLMTVGCMVQAASHEIVKITGISTMTISRAVTALVKKGFLTAKTDPFNKRRKILELTPSGHEQFHKLTPIEESFVESIIQDLSPEEIVNVSKLITKLAQTLETPEKEGKSMFIRSTGNRNNGK